MLSRKVLNLFFLKASKRAKGVPIKNKKKQVIKDSLIVKIIAGNSAVRISNTVMIIIFQFIVAFNPFFFNYNSNIGGKYAIFKNIRWNKFIL